PALSALLLRRRSKGSFEPLPWFVFLPLGAWLGHKLGIHWAGTVLSALNITGEPALMDGLKLWGPIAVGAVAVTLVGLLFGKPVNFLLGWSFRLFDRTFEFSTRAYTGAVSKLLRVSLGVLAVYGGLLYLTYWGFTTTPTGFIPQQDKGYLLVNVQL